MKVYFNGYRLDTTIDSVLSITYNFNNTLDGNDNSISHSNQIKIPLTKRNIAFFQDYRSSRKSPQIYQCHVINPRTGITIFFGFGYKVDKQPDGYYLEIYQNPIDFFDAIDQLTLLDLVFSGPSLTWDDTLAAASRNTTSGLVAPLLDYGQINPDSAAVGLYSAPVSPFNVLNYPPSVYFKTILEKIFDNQGYGLNTFNDDDYDNMILPYAKNTYTPTFKINEILPDMAQKDFLGQFQASFGVKFMLVDGSKTFTIKTIDGVARGGYYDWTKKFAGEYDNPVNTDLARNNLFKWGNTTLHSKTVLINNPYLPLNKSVFESKFEDQGRETYTVEGASITPVYGWQYALWNNYKYASLLHTYVVASTASAGGKAKVTITANDVRPVYNIGDQIFLGGGAYNLFGHVTDVAFGGTDSTITTDINFISNTATYIENRSQKTFDNDPVPTIAMVREPIAGVEPAAINFGVNSYSDYLVAYRYASYDGNQPPIPWLKKSTGLINSYSTNFGYVRDRYYNLNDVDVMQMVYNEKMIFDRGEIFLVNSIIDYVPNQPSKVQLIRVL